MLVAYSFDLAGNVAAQFLSVSDFRSRKTLGDVSSASFTLDPSEEGVRYANLKEYARIRVAYVEGNAERVLFDGFVRETSASADGISVTLNDCLYLLKKKKLYSAKTYSWTPISAILAEIFAEAEARYPHGLTVSTTVSATVSKEYKAFSSIFDVLKDLSEGGYEFLADGKEITFAEKVGRDLTSDPDLVEFRSDAAVPQEINVSSYRIRRDSENFANAVTALPSAGSPQTATDSDSVSEYGRIEESYPVDGEATAAAAAQLADRKDSVSEAEVTPFSEDMFAADLGDAVKVYVDGGDEMRFFDGALRVVEKSVSVSGASKSVELRLSSSKVSTPTVIDAVRDLRDRVKRLET